MKYGGINSSVPDETADSLLYAADNDFVCTLILWYNGIMPSSTYIWMMPHSLEKYLKSYLVKTNACAIEDIRKYKHNLKRLWDDFKEKANTTTRKPKLNQAFDDIIDDLDKLIPKLRYSKYIDLSSDRFLYFYIVLSSYLRYLLIGKQRYRSTLYGIDDRHFLPMNHSPMLEGYGKTAIRKMLHIVLEHAGMFTNLGFVNNIDLDEFSISNTAIFEQLPDCPICQGLPIDQLSLITFYRNLNPRTIQPVA